MHIVSSQTIVESGSKGLPCQTQNALWRARVSLHSFSAHLCFLHAFVPFLANRHLQLLQKIGIFLYKQ